MTREEEIKEFNALLSTLLKKYNVTLNISLVDLSKLEETNTETKPTNPDAEPEQTV